MAIDKDIQVVTFSQAIDVLLAAHDAGNAALLLGDPGVGKTALGAIVAKRVDKDLETLLSSTLDPTDVGGLPAVVDGEVRRYAIKPLRNACHHGVVLFADELTGGTPSVQSALLRVFLEREAGDERLHKDTWVFAAANPPEQAPGGTELSAPMMGRVAAYHLRPTSREVLDFFAGLGKDDPRLRAEALDFASTASVMPQLLQIAIPPGCVNGNRPWGSPRAWEKAVRGRAAAAARGGDLSLLTRVTAGHVGTDVAAAYEGVLKLRADLPTIEQIVADPAAAKLPDDKRYQIAALGMIPRVAEENTWAAWVYAGRLGEELAVASAHLLLRKKDSPLSAKHAREGAKARGSLAAKVARVQGVA